MFAFTTSPVETMSVSEESRSMTMSAPTLPFDICMQAITMGMMSRLSCIWSLSFVCLGMKYFSSLRMR